MGQWEESEQYVRNVATSYPTTSGAEWYRWCVRTGRGDRTAAHDLAIQFIELEWVQEQKRGKEHLFAAHLTEDRPSAALELVQEIRAQENSAYWLAHQALLAAELGKDDLRDAAIKAINGLGEQELRQRDPEFHALVNQFCRMMESVEGFEEHLDEIDKQLGKISSTSRCNFEYFVGVALDLKGASQKAEEYYTRAVTKGPFDRCNATFAGKRLAERNGTSR